MQPDNGTIQRLLADVDADAIRRTIQALEQDLGLARDLLELVERAKA